MTAAPKSRTAPLALLFFVVSACSSGETRQASKTASSTTVVLPAVDSSGVVVAGAARAAPVAAPRIRLDTAIPAMSLDTMPWTDTRRMFDTTADAPSIQCGPSIFTPADTLGLRLTVPHGGWLKVTRPDETVFNIVSPSIAGEPNYSVIPSDSFRTMPLIRFHGDIESRPLASGRENVEAIFGQPGRYTFTVGDSLQSSRRIDVRECTIRLVPLSRY